MRKNYAYMLELKSFLLIFSCLVLIELYQNYVFGVFTANSVLFYAFRCRAQCHVIILYWFFNEMVMLVTMIKIEFIK